MQNIDVNVQDTIDLNTPLHIAILKNHRTFIHELINHPKINLNIKNKSRFTPLQLYFKNSFNFYSYDRESTISLLEDFAKHQDLQNYKEKILNCFKNDLDRLKLRPELSKQLFKESE